MTDFATLKRKYEHQLIPILEPGFEQDLFQAVLDNLKNHGPLCFNNFAYSLRELIRHILYRMAPNSELTKCVWFKPDSTSQNGITRAHRAIFAIRGGLSDAYLSKILSISIKLPVKRLMDAITTLHQHTHIQEDTFNADRSRVLRLAEDCLSAAAEFCQTIADCRNQVIQRVAENIDKHLVELALTETIGDIDVLSTHHQVEELTIDSINVDRIGVDHIELTAEGTISVLLQYGSDSDMENDMGAEIDDSFPFHAVIAIPLLRPLGKTLYIERFEVNTDSWCE